MLLGKEVGRVCQEILGHRQMMLITSNQQLFLTLPLCVVQEGRNKYSIYEPNVQGIKTIFSVWRIAEGITQLFIPAMSLTWAMRLVM